MKGKILVIAMLLAICVLAFAGCSGNSNYDGKTKIVYQLEGGLFKNCTGTIVQYYDFEENSQNLIRSPQTFSPNSNVERAGYRFTGWFKTKIQNGDEITYSDEWDFAKDKVTTEGITLYAGWEKNIAYTYNVCYVENGETKSLGVYKVDAGDEFKDTSNYAKKRTGYTPLVYKKDGVQVGYYLDEDCTRSVVDYKHPGGDTDCQINVYVKYIQGSYALVSTATELSKNSNRNIYLLNDIDLEGASFSIASYSKVFEGNGHKIYNFTVPYNASKNDLIQNAVYASIFGVLDGATIKNVTFEDATLTIKGGVSLITDIYVAPFAREITNSTIEDVNVNNFNCIIDSLPYSDFDRDQLNIDSRGYIKCDDKSKLINLVVDIRREDNTVKGNDENK